MIALSFTIGTLFGVAAMILLALYLAAKDAKPEAKPHQFSAVSTGADGDNEFRQIFKALEHAEQKTRH